MLLFGALSTAISGLNAQSAAFGNISDNVANSQTTGFKRVDTSFVDYLTTSTAKENEPEAVVAQPSYVNNVQGTVTQTDNPLGMAITGQGFFAVSQATSVSNGVPTFNTQQFVTAQVVPQKAACGRARDRKANFSSANSPTDRVSEGVPGHHRGVPGQLQQFYTRAGDFSVDANGYMVNSAGQYLNGWAMNAKTDVIDMNA